MKKRQPDRPRTHSRSAELPRRGRILLLLAAILVAGVSVRVWRLDRSTIEHFDEGVYASNLWFGEQSDYRYPLRHLYAPPLLPALIEWTMILSGRISGTVALVPSLLAGCATIGLVGWCAARWLGPSAAIAAMCLIAASDVHVMFTRAALTDALLLFWIVAAMGLFERAFRSERPVHFVLAGIAVGLAWWTKYNGWLPLPIALAGAVPAWVAGKVPRGRAIRQLAGWGIALACAIAVWSPFLFELQAYGGYAEVAANHRKYLVGASGWLNSLERQLASLQFVDSALGAAGWGGAVLLAWCGRWFHPDAARRTRATTRAECLAAVALSGVAAALAGWMGASVLCLAVSAGVLPLLWLRRMPRERITSLSIGFLSAWFTLMLVLTPLYTPYLRLMLPWLSSSWLASGLAVDMLLDQVRSRYPPADVPVPDNVPQTRAIGLVIGAAVLLIAAAVWITGAELPVVWREDRRGLEHAAVRMKSAVMAPDSRMARDTPQVVYVYAEPALLFHLRSVGIPFVVPVDRVALEAARVGSQPVPTFLAFGLHAQSDPQFQSQFARAAPQLVRVGRYAYSPSSLVWLDHQDPRTLPHDGVSAEVQLYQLR
jgi:4-amino-4-deoxy-L-arabinose transferase-like glycosyltransferase